jgi:hypothetical protein
VYVPHNGPSKCIKREVKAHNMYTDTSQQKPFVKWMYANKKEKCIKQELAALNWGHKSTIISESSNLTFLIINTKW